MKISVIIPTYNRAHLIERAVNSVLNQTQPPAELIVVDDHSRDNSLQVLEKYAESIHILRNDENRGVSYSRNQGLHAASGEWIAFLDSDDAWDSRKLEKQVQFHQEHLHLKISQCDEIWIRKGVRVNPMIKHAKKGGWIFEACLPLCIVSPSAVIIHRSLFNELGVFDESLPACEDYDLWLRIAQKYEIGLLDEQLVTRYGGHEDQLSQKYWGMDRFRIQAMEKHVDANMQPKHKKALLEQLVFKCRVVLNGAEKRNNLDVAEAYSEKLKIFKNLLVK